MTTPPAHIAQVPTGNDAASGLPPPELGVEAAIGGSQ